MRQGALVAGNPARRNTPLPVIRSATAIASSTVRAPVRPPGAPSSTSTVMGRGTAVSASAATMASTVAVESAQVYTSRAGCSASRPASQRSPAGSTRALARMIRCTP